MELQMKTKIERKPIRPVYPTPAGLVVSIDAKGKPNIITLGEIFNLSIRNPVWVGIAIHKARYSWSLIKEQGEFTVNMPTAAMVNKVQGCGSCSGRDGTDKFAKFNLTAQPSKYVKPPIIVECPVNLECKVVGFHTMGDHDLFIGEVILEHLDEDAANTNGDRDESKLDPLIWLGRGYYRLGEKVGEHRWQTDNGHTKS
jgi:flavin reductase (DIM6/NTAB) family NADH-FMN oxidoreductase RutF